MSEGSARRPVSVEVELRRLVKVHSVQASTGGEWRRHDVNMVICRTESHQWEYFCDGSSDARTRAPGLTIPFEAIDLMAQEQVRRHVSSVEYHVEELRKAARVTVAAAKRFLGPGDSQPRMFWQLQYHLEALAKLVGGDEDEATEE